MCIRDSFRFSRIASAFLPPWGTGGMVGSTPDTFICLRFSMFCWAVAAIGIANASDDANSPIPSGLEAGIGLLLDELQKPTGSSQPWGASPGLGFFWSER